MPKNSTCTDFRHPVLKSQLFVSLEHFKSLESELSKIQFVTPNRKSLVEIWGVRTSKIIYEGGDHAKESLANL